MDLTAQVTEAINAWLANLATSLLRPALEAAGQLLFQTPTLDAIPEVEAAWTVARDVADALFALALIGAGILIMSSGSFNGRYTAKVLVPRLALAAISANTSLVLCGALIHLNNALVGGLLGADTGPGVLAQLASMTAAHGTGELVGVVLALAAAALAMLLVALYAGRDLVLVVVTALAPLALATYALPQTDELARLWWRIFCALLFVQVVQAVLITVGAQLLAHADWLGAPVSQLTSGLLLLTLLFLLFKLPFAAYQWAFSRPLRVDLAIGALGGA